MAPSKLNSSVKNIRKTRVCLTLKEKLEIIRDRQNGVTAVVLAKKFKVDPSTISKIVRQKDVLLKIETRCSIESTKKLAKQKYERINKAMWLWFNSVRNANIPIQGPLIQEKALFFAKKFDQLEFVASDGWLQRFLNRNKLVVHHTKGEQLSSNIEEAMSFKEELREIIEENGYSDEDLYNADETGNVFDS